MSSSYLCASGLLHEVLLSSSLPPSPPQIHQIRVVPLDLLSTPRSIRPRLEGEGAREGAGELGSGVGCHGGDGNRVEAEVVEAGLRAEVKEKDKRTRLDDAT